MGQWAWVIAVGAGLTIWIAGCKKPSGPPMPDIPQHQDDKPAGPTTQELLKGPRKRIALSPLPVSAEVPQGWSIVSPAGTSFTFLQGPLPEGGEVHIQLTHKPPLWTDEKSPMTMDERLELLKEAAQKEQKASPRTIKSVDLRSIGQVKIFEKQSLFQPVSDSELNEEGKPISVPLQYHWTITFFVPHDKTYQSYEMNFLDLTEKQYATNHDFLHSIIDSLKLQKSTPNRQDVKAEP
jgi:hypothetical protein